MNIISKLRNFVQKIEKFPCNYTKQIYYPYKILFEKGI